MKTYLHWRFVSEFLLNIHIHIRYSNNYHWIALFVFVFVLILRTNTIRIRIRFIFRKRILFVFVFVPKLLFIPTLISSLFTLCMFSLISYMYHQLFFNYLISQEDSLKIKIKNYEKFRNLFKLWTIK